MDSLGDRIKGYENINRQYLTGRTPVMLRLDGRAFHTFTRRFNKPFDDDLMNAMVLAATDVINEIEGAQIGYVQSDEVSIAFHDYGGLNSVGWFGYNLSKILTISASLMTIRFAHYMGLTDSSVVFDCRAFNIPADDIANAFLWRAQDWSRNSLSMFCQANTSHKNLHGKNREAQHELLHEMGLNWTMDLTAQQRNGTFLKKENGKFETHCDILPTYPSIADYIGNRFEYPVELK